MSTLYVTEVSEISFDRNGNLVMAPDMPGTAEQAITLTGASAASAAFNIQTRYVLLHTDANCCLAFGAAPVALAGFHRMAQNETRFYGVNQGDKVAVISSS